MMKNLTTSTDMREYIDADTIFAEVLITRNGTAKVLVLVEGDSDCNTLDPHLDAESCETLPAKSKLTVIEVLKLANQQQIDHVIGLVDRDWIGFGDNSAQVERLFVTDFYDLEATIFFSGELLDRFFAAHTERQARTHFLADRNASTVRDLLVRIAQPVGVLRLLSHRNKFNLSMRHFPAHVAMNQRMTEIDTKTLVGIARGKSKNVAEADEVILRVLNGAIRTIDPKDSGLCAGWDLATCLMGILAHKFSRKMSIEVLLASIRAMVTTSELSRTKFFSDIEAWATENKASVWQAT